MSTLAEQMAKKAELEKQNEAAKTAEQTGAIKQIVAIAGEYGITYADLKPNKIKQHPMARSAPRHLTARQRSADPLDAALTPVLLRNSTNHSSLPARQGHAGLKTGPVSRSLHDRKVTGHTTPSP